MSCSLSCLVTKLTKYDILLIHLQFQWSDVSSLLIMNQLEKLEAAKAA